MNFKKLMHERRSVRGFEGGKIPGNDMMAILDAGQRAPNACNYQSWHFYCIVDPEKIVALIPEVCTQAWIKTASAVIVITEDNTRLKERWGGKKADLFVAEDAGAAAQNMLLMAAELGYDGCFVGAFDEDKCRTFLGAKECERPVVMLPIGICSLKPQLRDRKPMEETVTIIGDLDQKEVIEGHRKPLELKTGYYGDAVFFDVNLQNASFKDVTLSGASFENCCLKDVSLTDCCIEGMTINGISVKELLDKAK